MEIEQRSIENFNFINIYSLICSTLDEKFPWFHYVPTRLGNFILVKKINLNYDLYFEKRKKTFCFYSIKQIISFLKL